MKLSVFDSSDNALRSLSERLIDVMEKNEAQPFHIALSGGETAQVLFNIWTKEYREKIAWERLRFFWVDERCVALYDEQSNYKHADELLFRPLNISSEHIHRIFGEQEPETEAGRYSEQVKWELPGYSTIPRFDCIILGIGHDGHTGSIFPNVSDLLTDKRCYAVSEHPETGQKRITMTGSLMLKAKSIFIPVLGLAKVDALRKVLDKGCFTPAGYILEHAPDVEIFTNCKLD